MPLTNHNLMHQLLCYAKKLFPKAFMYCLTFFQTEHQQPWTMSVTNVFVVIMHVYMFVSLCSFYPTQEVPEVLKIKQKFKYSHSHDRKQVIPTGYLGIIIQLFFIVLISMCYLIFLWLLIPRVPLESRSGWISVGFLVITD